MAVEGFRSTGRSEALIQALINLSAFAAGAGEFELSLSAATEAHQRGPAVPEALMNLYIAQMHSELFQQAAETARKLRSLEDPVVSLSREMDALIAGERFRDALDLFEGNLKAHPSLADRPHALCLKARAFEITRYAERSHHT